MNDKYSDPEKGIIYLLMERRRAFEYIEKRLEHITFRDSINETIKLRIIELFHSDQLENWQSLLNSFEGTKYQKRIIDIWEFFDGLDISDDEKLRNYIKLLHINFLQDQKKELKQEIKLAMKSGYKDMAKIFMTEYKKLLKELEKRTT